MDHSIWRELYFLVRGHVILFLCSLLQAISVCVMKDNVEAILTNLTTLKMLVEFPSFLDWPSMRVLNEIITIKSNQHESFVIKKKTEIVSHKSINKTKNLGKHLPSRSISHNSYIFTNLHFFFFFCFRFCLQSTQMKFDAWENASANWIWIIRER